MLARQAVLLTLPSDGNRPHWSYHHTGTLPRLISFVSHSYENTGGVGVFFPFRNSPVDRRTFDPAKVPVSRSTINHFRLNVEAPRYSPSGDPDPVGATVKSFSCNTYGSPRKCCKQKTYDMAKP